MLLQYFKLHISHKDEIISLKSVDLIVGVSNIINLELFEIFMHFCNEWPLRSVNFKAGRCEELWDQEEVC